MPLEIRPYSVNLGSSGTQQLRAYLDNRPLTSGVTWNIEGGVGGSITSGGLFTAPVVSAGSVAQIAITVKYNNQTADSIITVGTFISPASGVGGTVDSVSRAADAANQAAINQVRAVAGDVVPAGQVRFIDGKLWENKTAAAITVPATTTDAALTGAGLTAFTGSTQVNEVVLSASADLVGAAPAGAKEGIRLDTGTQFVVSGGNWAVKPTDAGTTVFTLVRSTETTTAPTVAEIDAVPPTGRVARKNDVARVRLPSGEERVFTHDGAGWVATSTLPAPLAPLVVADLASLPDPATVLVGRSAVVTNDGSNSGSYSAIGAAPGATALSWLKDG